MGQITFQIAPLAPTYTCTILSIKRVFNFQAREIIKINNHKSFIRLYLSTYDTTEEQSKYDCMISLRALMTLLLVIELHWYYNMKTCTCSLVDAYFIDATLFIISLLNRTINIYEVNISLRFIITRIFTCVDSCLSVAKQVY